MGGRVTTVEGAVAARPRPKSASPRARVLRALWKEPHRYDRLRAVSMAVSVLLLLAVPLTGLARVDLWSGHHMLLGREVSFRYGLAGVIVAIAAMYVVTFLSNVFAGRMFCGWGCPVGQISRFADAVDLPAATRLQRTKTIAVAAAFGMAVVLAFFAWWVDLGVFVRASGPALWLAWGSLALAGVTVYGHARSLRWRFCMQLCPIGLYYSFVSPATWFGVHFRNQQSSCVDCDACDQVCPVDLAPRDLARGIPSRGGLSVSDAPGRNHCLECGDCVRACEWILAKRDRLPIPLRLGYFSGPQRLDHPEVEAHG